MFPNSQIEPLYPKLFRGTPEVDLVPIVWHTAPPKVRIPRIHCRQKRLFLGVFLEKKSFPGKTVDFHLQHALQILKAIGPEVNLSYQSSLLKHPTRRQNFANTVDTLCAHYLTLRRIKTALCNYDNFLKQYWNPFPTIKPFLP